jgi:hypothetical protein
MTYELKKIINTLILIIILTTSFFGQSNTWTFNKTDSTTFKGLGLGFEYYSGHENISKNIKFKRTPIEEYNIGKGIYLTYFNFNQNKKFNYYIDGGFIFWNEKKINLNSNIDQRSEVIQITTKYKLGRFGILGRIGGLYNHKTISYENTLTKDRENTLSLSIGAGLSIPIFIKGLRLSTFVSKIDKYYYLSGTIVLPILFHQN